MDDISIYIHIPFCEQKCPYCDFYSISKTSEFDNFTDSLIERIGYFGSKYKRKVCSIYFGGGTPSVIGTDRLIRILNAVRDCFEITENCETTVEVNPCSSETLDFSLLKDAGFNRLSVGLQSADEVELKILGRRHNADMAKETVNRARKAGFKNISLDLMLCIPKQTKSSLTKSIEFCKDCGVEHISAYILKIEENTTFFKNKDSLDLFDDDSQAEMYIHAVNELEEHGYMQYEISNFSKVGFEGKHNLRYWKDKDYLGIGPSAHSFIDGKRFYYPRSIEDFYSNIIVDDGIGGDIEEYIMLSLRIKEGLNLNKLQKKYNFTLNINFAQKANKLKSEGLITFDNDIISLTKEGFLVSNTIINYLIDAI